MNNAFGLGSGGLLYNSIQRDNLNPRMESNMKQAQIMTKALIALLILSFSSAAYAHSTARATPNTSFSFSFQINGLSVGNGNVGNRNVGHYHTYNNGLQYFHYGPAHNDYVKPKPKHKPHYKLSSKKQLVRSLRKMGFRNVQNIRLNGRHYTATAISPRGHKTWVKVNRHNGYIAEQKIVAWNVRR